MSLESYARALPKAELHVHLEGSIQPATLLTLARRNGVTLPAESVEGLREWFRFRDFEHFVAVYLAITRCLRTAADYELIAYEFGAEMARQNTRYAEITFTPGTHEAMGIPHDVYFSGLEQGRARARADFGVEMRWIFDIVRNIPDPARRMTAADYTTRVAIEDREQGVVALGFAGLERGFAIAPFAPFFERARTAGLHVIPHAGETAGPESIWDAIRLLGAERIGHGVRAIEDPELVAYLAEHTLPLEVNVTSNLRLGIYPDLASHPLSRLMAAGVPITVNSDDPALFNTTLGDEFAQLGGPLGFDAQTIENIALNGLRYSLLPEPEKARLVADQQREVERLKGVHL
ncbi:MAG TPA: adenosine deaminase [Ktedonobacterales bacterium]